MKTKNFKRQSVMLIAIFICLMFVIVGMVKFLARPIQHNKSTGLLKGQGGMLMKMQSRDMSYEQPVLVQGVSNLEDDVKKSIQQLKSENFQIAQGAADKLASLGKKALPELIKALESAPVGLKGQVVFLFGRIADKEAAPVLIEMLKDDNAYIRRNAAEALGKIKDENAIYGLCNSLYDEDASVRQRSAWALGELGNSEAARELVNSLSKEQNQGVRVSMIRSLGKLENPVAASMLLNELKPGTYGQYIDEVLVSLGKIGDIKAIEEITKYVNALEQDRPTDEELVFEWQKTISTAEKSIIEMQKRTETII